MGLRPYSDHVEEVARRVPRPRRLLDDLEIALVHEAPYMGADTSLADHRLSVKRCLPGPTESLLIREVGQREHEQFSLRRLEREVENIGHDPDTHRRYEAIA